MSDLLFTCPKCSKHLAIDQKGCGSTIKCPDCVASLTVPIASSSFKCQACDYALSAPKGLDGTTFNCPNCNNEVVVPKKTEISEGKICTKCGTEAPDSSDFCKECGTHLSLKKSIQGNKCPKCGNGNKSDSTFCGECGTAIPNYHSAPPTSRSQKVTTCPQCHAVSQLSGSIYCAECGYNLKDSVQQQRAQPIRNELKLKQSEPDSVRNKPNAYKLVYHEQQEIASRACPYCNNPLPAHANICVHCGIDLRTGKKLRLEQSKATSNFDISLFIKLGVLCLVIWGCYEGYRAYKKGAPQTENMSVAKTASADGDIENRINIVAKEYYYNFQRATSRAICWDQDDFRYFVKAILQVYNGDARKMADFVDDLLKWEVNALKGTEPLTIMKFPGTLTDFDFLLKVHYSESMADRNQYRPSLLTMAGARLVYIKMKELGWMQSSTKAASEVNIAKEASDHNYASQPDRYYDNKGGFSYIPPAGWDSHISDNSGLRNWSLGNKEKSSINFNIIITDMSSYSIETATKSAMDGTITGASQVGLTTQVVDKEDFTTISGMRGRRIRFTHKHGGEVVMRTFLYSLAASDREIDISCYCIEANTKDVASIFDNVALSVSQ